MTDAEACVKFLRTLLLARRANARATIGQPGVPTQALADALVRALAQGTRVFHAELRDETLEDADFATDWPEQAQAQAQVR